MFRKKTNKLAVSKTFIRHYWPNILNRAQSTSGMRGEDQYTTWASNPVAPKVHSISFPQNLPSKHYLQRTSQLITANLKVASDEISQEM